MPRFNSINFYQSRPKIKLVLPKKIQNFLALGALPKFWPCLFSFRRCHMHLQSYLMRAGGQILWKKAEPNHQRIADD